MKKISKRVALVAVTAVAMFVIGCETPPPAPAETDVRFGDADLGSVETVMFSSVFVADDTLGYDIELGTAVVLDTLNGIMVPFDFIPIEQVAMADSYDLLRELAPSVGETSRIWGGEERGRISSLSPSAAVPYDNWQFRLGLDLEAFDAAHAALGEEVGADSYAVISMYVEDDVFTGSARVKITLLANLVKLDSASNQLVMEARSSVWSDFFDTTAANELRDVTAGNAVLESAFRNAGLALREAIESGLR